MRKLIVAVSSLLVLNAASYAQDAAAGSVAESESAASVDSGAVNGERVAAPPEAAEGAPQWDRLYVNFEPNSLKLTSRSANALDSASAEFAKNNLRRYEVHGYSCPGGAGQSGAKRLAPRRVERMVEHLMSLGVPGENIMSVVNAPKSGGTAGGCTDDLRVDILSIGTRWRADEMSAVADSRAANAAEASVADSLKAEMRELKRRLAETEASALAPPPPAAPEIPAPKPAEAEAGKQAVAVYMAGAEPAGAKGVHTIMGGELARVLSESDKYTAVDRTEAILEQLDREHVYQRSGAVDDAQIKAIGHQLGVGYLCISNINAVGRKYYLDTRLVDVVTAEISRSVTATSGLKDAGEMSRTGREIALELLENEKTLKQRKLRKKIFRYTAIGLDALGALSLAYGYMEDGNVAKRVDVSNPAGLDYPEAARAATRRNAAYIAGGVLLASGVTIHILF
jgi:hypothetical protein